jgi:hypothetical protein
VGVPAVVGLVVEDVHQRLPARLALRLACGGGVFEVGGDVGGGEAVHVADHALVFPLARRAQVLEVLEKNRVQLALRTAGALEAAHPNAVGDQQVVQRAVQAVEKDPGRAAVVVIGERGGGGVEAPVGPTVVGRHGPEMRRKVGHRPSSAGRVSTPTLRRPVRQL